MPLRASRFDLGQGSTYAATNAFNGATFVLVRCVSVPGSPITSTRPSLGSDGDQRFEQAKLGWVGHMPVEIPHDVLDTEVGSSDEVILDLGDRSRQRRSGGGVEGGFGDGIAYPEHDRARCTACRSRCTEERDLVFKSFPVRN